MNRIIRHCLIFIFVLVAFALRAGGIFPVDTIHTVSYNCQQTGVCIPLPATSIQNYIFFQNGQPYASGMSGCDFDTTIAYSYNTLLGVGNMGPYHLDTWSVNDVTYSGMFMNINDLVALMNLWDPLGAWIHEPATLTIKGGHAGQYYSAMQVTAMSNQTPSIIGMNFGLLPQGTRMMFNEGTHSLIVWDNASGLKDTLIVIVECYQMPPPTTIYDTIPANGLQYTICFNTTDLLGTPQTIFNACPDESGTYVNFYIDEDNFCVKYQGLVCDGTEQACIVICDEYGMCDTTFLVVYVDNSECESDSRKIIDTVLINFTSVYCINTALLPGAIVSVENLCPGDSGQHVDFEYNETTHCIEYTGFAPNLDQAEQVCYLLTDEFGNTDTTYLCVFVRLPEVGTIIDTILLGQNEAYCFDTTELAGNIVSIENFCPALSGQHVVFQLNGVTLCANAQGISVGTDTACIVICDSYGVCDTTYVYVTVVPDTGDPCANSLPPIAVPDSASTLVNTPVNIDILANDTLGNCLPVSLTLLNQGTGGVGPKHGFAVLNINQTVDYMPGTDICGVVDSFQYVLCSPIGCDTGLVKVFISCIPSWDSIIIYNGFSPNGDGINEVFKIENIELFPDNTLQVFNRWGNMVYQTESYKNTWKGTYQSADLPDGTYFYILELSGGRRTYKGFVQLHR